MTHFTLRAGSCVGCALLSAALLSASCGDSESQPPGPDPLEVPEGCNPLASDVDCLLPFPSDFYRTEGDDGVRVRISDAAMPRFEDVPIDVTAAHPLDGYSVGTPIIASFGEPIDDASFVFWIDDIDRSTTPESQTTVIDAETGEAVPHFAEIDPRATDLARQALIVRPLVRLAANHRYVVGLHGITRLDGSVIDAPKGFASLRDEGGKAHSSLEAMSAHYEADVFPLLESFGLERTELQLAWDFTTRSEESAAGDMLAIREDMRERLSQAPPTVTVVGVEDAVSEHIARRIELTIEVPLYVSSPDVGATLTASPPIATEMVPVPVTVWIPPSVMNRAPGDPPARLLQFGHGFFGSRYESNDFPSAFADAHGFVVVGADWWGMSEADRNHVAASFVENPATVLAFTDRVHQGMANYIALAAAAKGPIAALPELQIQGAPAYDPATLYFYGISMGQILGQTYFALSPDAERAAFSVGGANLSIMMFRASPFQPFLALLQTQMPDALDHQKFAAIAQLNFDRIDPLTYAPYIFDEPLPGAPPDRGVVMQFGVADSTVPNLGTYFAAKIIGVPLLEGAGEAFPPWLPTTTAPATKAALTPFDFGDEPNYAAAPADANDVHNEVRKLGAAQTQISDFFRPDGVITNTCDGVCDPE
ncbi:MAG: hypothetical protein HOW73_35890 [Polyangiaceae bacterium]|nr:hypothetical protein [Polyangiaceae bacterium]